MQEHIYNEFQRTALKCQDAVFVYQVSGNSCSARTYGEALQETQALIGYLAGLSLAPNARIGILSENCYQWWVAYLASVSLGLTVVPLDPQLSLDDWLQVCNHARIQVLFLAKRFCHQEKYFLEAVPGMKKPILFGESSGIFPPDIRENRLQGSDSANFAPTTESIASLVYTSGTNGNPKGVLLSHSNLISNARLISLATLRPGERIASILPLHHVYGFTVGLSTVLNECSLIFYSSLDQAALQKSFLELRPQYVIGVPAFFERLARGIEARIRQELPPRLGRALLRQSHRRLGKRAQTLQKLKRRIFNKIHAGFGGRIKFLASGGAPLDPQIIRFFNLLGIKLFEGYGLTETSPLIACNDDAGQRLGSVGKPIKDVQVKILNPDPKGIGEICVRGPNVMQGYCLDLEISSDVDTEGWFHTGDLGHLDRDGYLFISGRQQEVVITPNGKKVYPDELERHFSTLPLIRELCILGLPRAAGSRAQTVHLEAVPDYELAEQRGIADPEAAIKAAVARLSDQLPEYKRPTSLGFSKKPLPRTTTLKIKKLQVREDCIARQVSAAEGEPSVDLAFNTPLGSMVVSALNKVLSPCPPLASESLLTLDLGMDSLALLELFSTLQKDLGVSLEERELLKCKSVGELIAFLEKSAGSTAGFKSPIHPSTVQAPPASRLRKYFLRAFKRVFHTFSKLEIHGLENLPPQGSYILASNHECHLDNLFVACWLDPPEQERMVVLGKREHFDHFLTRWMARLCNAIPIDRNQVASDDLRTCAQLLGQNKILFVHPEGTRSPDGSLLPFKNGVALLANQLQCPIVPVYIEGGFEFWPKDALLPKRFNKISVSIGEPLGPRSQRVGSSAEVLAQAQQLTQELRNSIERLSARFLELSTSVPKVLLKSKASR